MININFAPEDTTFIRASEEYVRIWEREGKRITFAIEKVSGLPFKEHDLTAIVFEGISQSHPLKLRASYDENTKIATLVHELLHIISAEYMFALPEHTDDLGLGLHKQINLVLYDIWSDLYGVQFANAQVAIESERTPMYKEAWEWALSFSRHEREQQFHKLISK